MSQYSASSLGQSTMGSTMREFDPLVALHDHRLEEHPDWESSVLSDDEMIDLLKQAKDPKELAYLNIGMSKQTLPGDRGSILSFESPTGTDSQCNSLSSLSQ